MKRSDFGLRFFFSSFHFFSSFSVLFLIRTFLVNKLYQRFIVSSHEFELSSVYLGFLTLSYNFIFVVAKKHPYNWVSFITLWFSFLVLASTSIPPAWSHRINISFSNFTLTFNGEWQQKSFSFQWSVKWKRIYTNKTRKTLSLAF